MENEKILIGKKAKEADTILGPWTLIDYRPYIVNGKIKDYQKASEIASKLKMNLPNENI